MKSRSGHNSTKIGFMIFFYRDVTAFNQVPLTSLFSVTQHHEKRKQKGVRVFQWQEDINVVVISALLSTKTCLSFLKS